MPFDPNQRAMRPNEPLERKVDETNALLKQMLAEIKALRDGLAPKQVGLHDAKKIVERGLGDFRDKSDDDGTARYKDIDE